MITLIRNEFYKQKREWSFLFLLLLSLLPVLTGGAGAIFNSSTKTLADLFFFMNNQFAMFFPMVLFILVGFLFYQEYKNKTYINWITYGYSKRKLFFTKVSVALIIGVLFAAILLLLFICLIFALKVTGKVSADIPELLTVSVGFLLEAAIIIPVTVCAGAIIINLSRNIIISRYGDKYRPLAMLDSKRKASGLLHEYADEQAVQKLKRAQQQKIQSEHTPSQSKKKRIDFER